MDAAEKPVALLPGLGNWTHPIATRNAQPHKFFDQDSVMLYGFNRPEVLRSFRNALELDPHAAMTQWGVAMVLGPYLNMDMAPDVHIAEACDLSLSAAPKPAAYPVAQTIWRYSRALAFAARGRAAEAQSERAEFDKLRAALDRKMPSGNNPIGDAMNFAAVTLDTRLEPSVAAVPQGKRAVEMQDALACDERPAWYYPVRESLGAALLLSGDAVGAESVFREGLRRSPNNGRMLFGLLESLKAQSKMGAAACVDREYQTAWKGADVQLRLKDL